MENFKKNYEFEIALVGCGVVGKSYILLKYLSKYCKNTPKQSQSIYPVASFKIGRSSLVKFIYREIPSTERFKPIVKHLLNDRISGAIVFYNTANKNSFEGAKYWINYLIENCPRAPYILVGNEMKNNSNRIPIDEYSNRISIDNFSSIEHFIINALEQNDFSFIFESLYNEIFKRKIAQFRFFPDIEKKITAICANQDERDLNSEKDTDVLNKSELLDRCSVQGCSEFIMAYCEHCTELKNLCSNHANVHFGEFNHFPSIFSYEKIQSIKKKTIKSEIKKYRELIITQTSKIIESIQSTSKNSLKILKQLNKNIDSLKDFKEVFIDKYKLKRAITKITYLFYFKRESITDVQQKTSIFNPVHWPTIYHCDLIKENQWYYLNTEVNKFYPFNTENNDKIEGSFFSNKIDVIVYQNNDTYLILFGIDNFPHHAYLKNNYAIPIRRGKNASPQIYSNKCPRWLYEYRFNVWKAYEPATTLLINYYYNDYKKKKVEGKKQKKILFINGDEHSYYINFENLTEIQVSNNKISRLIKR